MGTNKYNKLENAKNNIGFIEIIDMIILFLYSAIILFDTKRYLNYDYGLGSGFTSIFLILRWVIVAVVTVKVIYYITSYPVYSFGSIIAVAYIIVFYAIKYEWDLQRIDSTETVLILVIIFIVGMFRIPYHRIIETYLMSFGLFFLIRIIGTITHILPSNHYLIEGRGEVTDFGFGHHNTTQLVFFFIAVAWIYIIRGKQYKEKIVHCIAIALIAFVLFTNTTSRTSTILIFVLCGGCVLYQVLEVCFPRLDCEKIMRHIRRVMLCAPVGAFIITIMGVIFYNAYRRHMGAPRFLQTMFIRFRSFSEDLALNGIKIPWQFVDESKCEGATFNWLVGESSKAQYCDNLYHNLFINCGIIILLAVIILFQYMAYRAYKKEDNITLFILFAISILNTMESTALYSTWNPFLLMALSKWDLSEKELLGDNRLKIPYKQQMKNMLGALGKRIYILFVMALLYISIIPMLAVLFAYQIDTNDVSDIFFWWYFITILLVQAIYNMVGGKRFKYAEIPPVKRKIRRHRKRIISSVIIMLLATVTVFIYTMSISTYDVDIDDTRLKNGVELKSNVSYRQIIPINNSGLRKITLYFDDYGDRFATVQLYMYNAYKTKNAYMRVDISEPNEKGAIELDMSNGDFLKGQILCMDFIITPNSWESAPVLNKVVYTFRKPVPVIKCIMMCLPFYLLIDLIWMIYSIIELSGKRER